MHYGIIGMGPVGTVFATHLKQAGHEVSILCEFPQQAEQFIHNPAVISGKLRAKAQFETVLTDLAEFVQKKPDVVFISTKSCHSKEILKSIKRLNPHDEMVFIACQNGLDVENQISEIFGNSRAWRLVLNFGVNFVRYTEVWVEFNFGHFLSHNPDNTDLTGRISDDLNTAGLTHQVSSNFKEEVFKKAILNSALGSPCALTRMTMKAVMEQPDLNKMVREVVRESIKIAQALGLNINDDYEQVAMDYLSKGGDHKPSLLVDIERNRQTENENHCGVLFHHAEKLGVDVPVIQSLYYLLKNLEKSQILNSYVSEGMKGENNE